MAGLSKKEIKEKDALLDALRVARDAVKGAITDANGEVEKAYDTHVRPALAEYNAALETATKAVEEAVDTYNEKLDALRTFFSEAQDEASNTFQDRSEKWQEGEKGQALSAWIESLEEIVNFDDLTTPDLDSIEVDEPTEMDLPEGTEEYIETIESVEDAPEEV